VCYDIREEWCIIWEKPGVDGSLEWNGLKNKGIDGPYCINMVQDTPGVGVTWRGNRYSVSLKGKN
jgi:hypothetical protein